MGRSISVVAVLAVAVGCAPPPQPKDDDLPTGRSTVRSVGEATRTNADAGGPIYASNVDRSRGGGAADSPDTGDPSRGSPSPGATLDVSGAAPDTDAHGGERDAGVPSGRDSTDASDGETSHSDGESHSDIPPANRRDTRRPGESGRLEGVRRGEGAVRAGSTAGDTPSIRVEGPENGTRGSRSLPIVLHHPNATYRWLRASPSTVLEPPRRSRVTRRESIRPYAPNPIGVAAEARGDDDAR